MTDQPFQLDPFQLEAISAIEAGRDVLVSAPTGSGKTMIAFAAIDRALERGERAFYTTPIKALSNQKMNELAGRLGAERVGLLTGDTSIRADADVVVVTTEVLRNMLYRPGGTPDRLGVVILDEVHYLQDPWRGTVWEEVIISTPADVRFVSLSATVSNASEVGEWLAAVRGPTDVVVTTHRPVPLEHRYAADDPRRDRLAVVPLLDGERPSAVAEKVAAHRARPPRRSELIDHLDGENLLPAIYFIFSRAACDDAVGQCLDYGLRLTTSAEADQILEIVDRHMSVLTDADQSVLGMDRRRAALAAGIAAHHAGLVPPLKEAVEEAFAAGLIKAVFATETLALGINMPARTVIIEKLSKFNGESRQLLTPGQFTQLTGRAGRRGIDARGVAVVAHSPWTPVEVAARLAASTEFRLTSAFRPTYNMCANLVATQTPEGAVAILNKSFAQFLSDRAVVSDQRRLDDVDERLARRRAAAECERGDVAAWVADRQEARQSGAAVDDALRALRPGSVIGLGPAAKPGVVIAVTERRNGSVRATVIARNGRRVHLSPDTLEDPPPVLGSIDLPTPYQPTAKSFQRDVARAVRQGEFVSASEDAAASGHPGDDGSVGRCPELSKHLSALKEIRRLERKRAVLERRMGGHGDALARRMERILALLDEWGYTDGWQLTDRGRLLAQVHHEADLLVAEAVEGGVFDGASAATVAGLASCFGYDRRRDGDPEPWYPSPADRQRVTELEHLWAALGEAEERHGLDRTGNVDGAMFAAMAAWAAGADLGDVLEKEDIAPGDFVRQARQVIDLCRRLSDIAPDTEVRAAAEAAWRAVDRGVVAASAR